MQIIGPSWTLHFEYLTPLNFCYSAVSIIGLCHIDFQQGIITIIAGVRASAQPASSIEPSSYSGKEKEKRR